MTTKSEAASAQISNIQCLPLEVMLTIVECGNLSMPQVFKLCKTCRIFYHQRFSLITSVSTVHKIQFLEDQVHSYRSRNKLDEHHIRHQKGIIRLISKGIFSQREVLYVFWPIRNKHFNACSEMFTQISRLWLHHQHQAKISQSNSDERVRDILLRGVFSSGDIQLVKLFIDTFGLTTKEVRSGDNFILRLAAATGSFECVIYLIESMGLTAQDVRAQSNCALRWACSNGHLQIVKYLFETVKLTPNDVRTNKNCALRWATSSGHIEMVHYLIEIANLTKYDILDAPRAKPNSFQLACKTGHLELVKFFNETFVLTKEDAFANQSRAFRLAFKPCLEGRCDVVLYLLKTFWSWSYDWKDVRAACIGFDLSENLEILKNLFMQVSVHDIVKYACHLLTSWLDSRHLNEIQQYHDPKCHIIDLSLLIQYLYHSQRCYKPKPEEYLLVVKTLFEIGITLDAVQTKSKIDLLRAACRGGHLTVVKFLFEEMGMDPSSVNVSVDGDLTPYDYAFDTRSFYIVRYLNRLLE